VYSIYSPADDAQKGLHESHFFVFNCIIANLINRLFPIKEAPMSIPFPSDAWIKAMMEDLNASSTYFDSARNWEGDFHFIVEPGGTLEQPITLYMDLYHGKCREAYLVTDSSQKPPAFRLSGPVANWKKVMTKKLDPMQAMMTGQLKLSGNMGTIMRNVRAAKELVESCTRIDTEFPV
jgi:putative sterol carrier protein